MLGILVRRYSTRQSISEILQHKSLGKCDVSGWVRNARKQKENTFLDLTDGSSFTHLQVVLPSSLVPHDLKHHSALRVSGDLIASSHKGQEVELHAQEIKVINSCEEPYPLQPRKHFSLNFVRQFPSYKSKTNSISSILRIRNRLTQAIHQYFQDNGFIQIHTPILTSNDCEGGGDVFKIIETKSKTKNKSEETNLEYFDKPVFLTVSGQLHLEAICNGISQVYNFNPAFRAEKGRTRRHLSEFWMVEAEMAFVEDIHVLMDRIEELVKNVTNNLLKYQAEDLKSFAKSAKVEDRTEILRNMVALGFHRITFTEACQMLRDAGQFDKVVDDFSREHELYLCKKLGGPVFVYNWPRSSKPFYMRTCQEDSDLVSCVDLLVPGVGELCGGSLREINATDLESRIEGSELEWYIDMRRKGSAPTAGFGLGFERLIQWLIGAENIKDTIPFYRSSHECQL